MDDKNSNLNPKTVVQKATGEIEAFDFNKLCDSLKQAGVEHDRAQTLCHDIEKKIAPGVSTSNIFRAALRRLVREDLHMAAKYNLRRGIQELGPAGFIFEQYLEALLRAYGFITRRNIFLQGECVQHEIDVEAVGEGHTYLVEAKYRNDRGGKTHVDTVMYSDARLMDVERKCHNDHQSCDHALWVITNAKFTHSAETYGECRNLKLTSWNYPHDAHLQKLIVDKKLYPVTVLPSVNRFAREAFAKHNMLLAQDLLPYSAKDLEIKFGLQSGIAKKIAREAGEIMK